MTGEPRIALALGAGGARGVAHVVVLEALDELGLRPVRVAGASIGAILGAAYAAGVTGGALRRHLASLLRRRQAVLSRLLEARVGRFADLLRGGLSNPVLVDAEVMLGLFWPPGMPESFADLRVPLHVVATDFFAHAEVVLHEGDLRRAVAASMAVPGLVRPVMRDGRVLVDGAAVNPLPCDLVAAPNTIVVACEVGGGPVPGAAGAMPTPFEAMFGSAQITQSVITAQMLAAHPPDVLIRPPVHPFRALDFFRYAQILRAAEPMKDEIKRQIAAAVERRDRR